MFTDEELDYLDNQRIGRLATSHPDGTLQNNPVGFGVNRALRTIDIGGYNMSRSRKFRNVAANGRAGFVVVDDVYSTDPWRVRFLEIRGHAEAIPEPADASDQMGGSAIIRLHPTRILSIGLAAGDLDDAGAVGRGRMVDRRHVRRRPRCHPARRVRHLRGPPGRSRAQRRRRP